MTNSDLLTVLAQTLIKNKVVDVLELVTTMLNAGAKFNTQILGTLLSRHPQQVRVKSCHRYLSLISILFKFKDLLVQKVIDTNLLDGRLMAYLISKNMQDVM